MNKPAQELAADARRGGALRAPHIPVALTIAGSDSSGGAGVQADLKTFSALGVYGASVLTALTAQNTRAVAAILEVPADFVRAQLEAVLTDLQVAVIKLGMLHGAAVIDTVAAVLADYPQIPVVLDPVMVAKGGAPLLAADGAAALRRLLPRATVLTPNLPEAAVLLGCDEAAVRAEPRRACAELRRLGPAAVVLKGGHAGGASSDDLIDTGSELTILPGPRLPTRHTHGTGCTFAAALAAGLGHGLALSAAAGSAKRYVTAAIAAADGLWQELGKPTAGGAGSALGHGPVHHFHALWPALPRALLP